MEHPHRQVNPIADRPGRPHGLVQALLDRLTLHRSARRVLACLECGLERMTGPDAGECPACGYLGWREAGDCVAGTRTVPLLARDAR